jgi:hypothetical protein
VNFSASTSAGLGIDGCRNDGFALFERSHAFSFARQHADIQNLRGRGFSRQGGHRGDIAQAGEPHDGLSGKFLRELHAALVVGTVGLVQMDVRQLFGAA